MSASPTPLRLLTGRGRLERRRPQAVLGGLLGRTGLLRAHTLWPSAEEPLLVVDVGSAEAASWLRRTFEPTARRRALPSAASWNALRARGVLVGQTEPLAVEAAERALGRPLADPRLAMFSPSGKDLSKATCFVFEAGRREPEAVVKLMPEPRFAGRLRHETEFVEQLRRRLAGHEAVVSALPLPPLFCGDVRGDYVVVQAPDPLASGTGSEDRPAAMAWLRDFQAATTTAMERWGPADEARIVEAVTAAWRRARPATLAAVLGRLDDLMPPLRGRPFRRCARQGDFWRGNVATRDGRLRVYDWEWAVSSSDPFYDLWSYELGDPRERADRGEEQIEARLDAALERVRAELARQGVDAGFAAVTLLSTIADLSFRVRRATGRPGGREAASVRVMAAAEASTLRAAP